MSFLKYEVISYETWRTGDCQGELLRCVGSPPLEALRAVNQFLGQRVSAEHRELEWYREADRLAETARGIEMELEEKEGKGGRVRPRQPGR
jgi:hypothetical protein